MSFMWTTNTQTSQCSAHVLRCLFTDSFDIVVLKAIILINPSAMLNKTDNFANSVDPDETASNEPSH